MENIYQNKFCLSIGINLYNYYPRLNGAVHDAIEFASILKSNFGFQSMTLIDKEAQKDKIREVMIDDLPQKANEDDLVIVFFAGHGHTELLADQRQHGYIVPIDARLNKLSDLISMNEITQWTDYLKSRHILYIFDSCFSGTATLRSDPNRRSRDMLQRKARISITAGGADQRVVDSGWNGHSVFTGRLLLGLLGEADHDNDSVITATELFNYLAKQVPKERQLNNLLILPLLLFVLLV